jgi:hypothetical protein
MEGGSPSCCAGARGSTIRTTPAPPSGTATTRTTSIPMWASVPAVSLPQHPSPSEPLEGIPAGAHEGSRPAPEIGDNRRQGLPLTHDRTIRTAPAHCPTAPATWVTRWAFAALTPTTPPRHHGRPAVAAPAAGQRWHLLPHTSQGGWPQSMGSAAPVGPASGQSCPPVLRQAPWPIGVN